MTYFFTECQGKRLITTDRQGGRKIKRGRTEHPVKHFMKSCPWHKPANSPVGKRKPVGETPSSGEKKKNIPKDVASPAFSNQSPLSRMGAPSLPALSAGQTAFSHQQLIPLSRLKAICKIHAAASVQFTLMVQLGVVTVAQKTSDLITVKVTPKNPKRQ